MAVAVGVAVVVGVALPKPSAPLNCRLHPAGSGWSLQDSAMVLMPGLAEALLPNSTSGRLLAWQPSGGLPREIGVGARVALRPSHRSEHQHS